MNFFRFVFQDWKANKGNTKGRIITFFFRIANFAAQRKYLKYFFLPYIIWYKIFIEWGLGFELSYVATIGKSLKIFHCQAIVVNAKSIIGENCTIRQSLTIGNKEEGGECPVIGNNVDIGAMVCIIGPITIGNNVKIGAGSVIVKDVPDSCIAVGNPARVINKSIDNGK